MTPCGRGAVLSVGARAEPLRLDEHRPFGRLGAQAFGQARVSASSSSCAPSVSVRLRSAALDGGSPRAQATTRSCAAS